ncbi:MAG TPA: LysE family transporter [Chitinophagaceae bacterium]|jgi:threonine/homoserine/homoserine lactone efflux protein|nr:LysE family transporter [Chitinophagaceae bacterium]OPZ19162.1 MAG: LysE type translocator [Bacteroidetes bacterium ADurb.BinA245]HMW66757.1 LysE family transporter [Chitinophagaceae bacterium]HMX76614.1 LysE family transporter [Chitinophagaceae bacterium]HNA92454.1 LysE family transporter [Chitinophagaceae bacterium]
MIEAIIKGFTLGLVLSISVGPVLFTIIKQSLNNGHKGGLAFVFGVSASDVSMVLLVNLFTELFAELKEHKNAVGIVGCVFLVVMGIYYLFFKKIKVDEQGNQVMRMRKRDFAKVFLSGYFMNTLNPSVFIFWIYASTAVINHSLEKRVVAFVTCLVWMLGTDILKVFLAGKIRNRLTPHNIHILNRINGFILIIFGIALIWGLLFYGHRI